MPNPKFPFAIDISHWIEVLDFHALDPKPLLIGMKATQGTNILDALYGIYIEEIRAIGARLLHYHFMDTSDPVAQADWFCEIITQGELQKDEVLACDMEMDGISLAKIKTFLDRTQSNVGIRPLTYSTQLRLEGLYPNGVCPAWLKSELLWIAEYPKDPDLTDEIPDWIIPRGLTINNIAMWQYSDDGVMPGIEGNNVDFNLINPIYAQAIGLDASIPQEPEPGETTMNYGKVLTSLNIRPSAGTIYNPIGALQTGDLVEADAIINGWWHLTKITRAGVNVSLPAANSYSYEGATNGYIEPIPAPTEDDEPKKITVEMKSGAVWSTTIFTRES